MRERKDRQTMEQGDITIEELRNTVVKIRKEKTPGHDGKALNLSNHVKK